MHKFKLSEKTMDKTNKLILYKDDEGRISVNVRFADEDVWLTQAQLAMIYDTTQENISMHISGIYKDAELDVNRTYKKFLLVRQEGTRQVKRNIDHYNLDMIIALGYRVQSPVAVRFRRWATQRLHEYIQKENILEGNGTISHQDAIERRNVSLKYTEREKCGCWKATSTRQSKCLRRTRQTTMINRFE